MDPIVTLINVLKRNPKSNEINELIKLAQSKSSVDITNQINLLTGVWELKWSTSTPLF